MNIEVRYQSRGGNTKTVAEAIAKAAGVTAKTIGAPIAEPVDLLRGADPLAAHRAVRHKQ